MPHRAIRFPRCAWVTMTTAAALGLAGCGGGGSQATAASVTSAGSPINYVPLVLDAGPAQVDTVNALYTTVTLCAPSTSTACQTIDHVLVDSGSSGFRILAEALGNGLSAAQLTPITDANGNALAECAQFVDGYSWGSVKIADLKIGDEVAASVPIQVIGDPAVPTIPSACINVPDGEEDTVATFGANAVLGVGNFVQDCGPYCTQTGLQDGSAYNVCATTLPLRCSPAAVPLAEQVTNPVSLFPVDNNGVLIEVDAVSDAGAATASGELVFGIGTQSNNGLGSAALYTLDPDYGTLFTTYAGTSLDKSFMDTGSNAYFFPQGSIPVCRDQPDFFCPTSTLSLTAQIQGLSGAVASVSFAVANADQMSARDFVEPDLGGPASSGTPSSFDWGLPFFMGRHVYVGLEATAIANARGPLDAF